MYKGQYIEKGLLLTYSYGQEVDCCVHKLIDDTMLLLTEQKQYLPDCTLAQ